MTILRSFAMAIKSILNNKMRSFLTMLGIIIGVCSVITLVTVIDGYGSVQMEYYEAMGSNILELNYYSWGGFIDLGSELEQEVAELSDYVAGITPSSTGNAVVRYRNKTLEQGRIHYASKDFAVCKNMELTDGRNIAYMDVENRTRVCVIGSYVKEELFGLEDPIGKQIKIRGVDYTVIGTYDEKFGGEEWSDDAMIAVPMSHAKEISALAKFESYIIKAKDGHSTDMAMYYLQLFLDQHIDPNTGSGYVYTNNEWQEIQQEGLGLISLIGGGIAGISLLVGGIGIMNIMLVSVSERTREIGIRLAIGAKRSSIVAQFLIEAATVSICGGILGVGLGYAGASIATSLMLQQVFYPSISIITISLGISVALGVFFGFYPAFKASGMQPVDALRNQ